MEQRMSADSISTSPLAMRAYQLIKHLDQIVGPIEAQAWMLRGNELLGSITPVGAIKERRIDDVLIRSASCRPTPGTHRAATSRFICRPA